MSNDSLWSHTRVHESPKIFVVKCVLACFLAFACLPIGGVPPGDLPAIPCSASLPFISQNAVQISKCLRFLHGGSMRDLDGVDSSNRTTSSVERDDANFTLISETLIYENWRRLISRRVQLPSGLIANFEVVGQKRSLVLSRDRSDNDLLHSEIDHHNMHDQAVLIFVWHRSTQTTTLIREYMPSVHRKMYGLAAGMVEGDKHHPSNWKHPATGLSTGNISLQEVAARCELEEECRLRGGEWFCLTKKPVVMDKYSMTGLTVFLVLDPLSVDTESEINETFLQRDESEESMEIITNVTLQELEQRIESSELTAVGSWACLLAMYHLRSMGEV